MGPWTDSDQTGTAGELNFGLGASAPAIGLEALQVGFLRTFIDDTERERGSLRVKLFVMGDNVWRDEDDWPLARTAWTRWYLHPAGSLSPELPASGAPASSYRHDPADPVPTAGGPTLIPASPDGSVSWMGGPRDQRAVESRPDVLSFTSEVLASDLEVTGPLTVTLHAATSVIATSQVFKAGHRVRVDIASSNFPCFDRNPGNGASSATATERDFVVAEQTVCHDAAHRSYSTLPVIPR